MSQRGFKVMTMHVSGIAKTAVISIVCSTLFGCAISPAEGNDDRSAIDERGDSLTSTATPDPAASSPGESAAVQEVGCLDLLCYHPGCNDITKSRTADCVSAMSRYCGDRGFQLGFSQEVGPTAFAVACKAAPFRADIPLSELVARHPGCDDVGKSQQGQCVAAIHRACNARGFGAGLSQEVGATAFRVACVQPEFFGNISLAELRARHPGCSNVDLSQTPDCTAAVHRACNARGLAAGFAQEVGPDAFAVACFSAGSFQDVPVIL